MAGPSRKTHLLFVDQKPRVPLFARAYLIVILVEWLSYYFQKEEIQENCLNNCEILLRAIVQASAWTQWRKETC